MNSNYSGASHNMLTLDQAYDFLCRYGLRLVVGLVIGVLVALAVASVLPKRWEATAILELGRIDRDGSTQLVEPPYQAAARVRLRSLQNSVLRSLGLPLEPEGDSELLRRSLHARVVRDTDLVQVQLRAPSPELAERWLEAVIARLTETHAEMLGPTLSRLQREHQEVESDLARALRRQEELLELVGEVPGGSEESTATGALLLNSLMAANDSTIGVLRRREVALREQLDEARSFNIHVLGAIEVSRHPVFPRRVLFMAAGGLLGLLIVFSYALMREYQRQRDRASA